MSTPIEKIDVEKVRGEYVNMTMPEVTGLSYGFQERGDDTTQSLKLLAEKINEIIDVLNEKQDKPCTHENTKREMLHGQLCLVCTSCMALLANGLN